MLRVVRHGYRLGLVAEPDQRRNRSEDLLGEDGVGLVDVGEHRGRVEPTGPVER